MGSQNSMGIGSGGLNGITMGFWRGQDFVDKMSIYFVVGPIQTDPLSIAIVGRSKGQSY